MKFSYSSLALVLFSGAVAAPSSLEQRDDPPNDPIHLNHALPTGDTVNCGGNSYTDDQIYQSVQYAVNLQLAGETRGKAKYPHSFQNDDSKGNKLVFPTYCPADTNRMEYPLLSPVYNGGKNNVKTGQERVVYYSVPNDDGVDGHPNVEYCGVMTHTGAPTGGFLLC